MLGSIFIVSHKQTSFEECVLASGVKLRTLANEFIIILINSFQQIWHILGEVNN